jgi:hypothetical protein
MDTIFIEHVPQKNKNKKPFGDPLRGICMDIEAPSVGIDI